MFQPAETWPAHFYVVTCPFLRPEVKCISSTSLTSDLFYGTCEIMAGCVFLSLLQTISAKAMDCLRTSFRRATTTNWCCPSSRVYPTKWTSPSTFALCCPTRASTPCSWTRIPSWSRCCWPTPASSTTVRSPALCSLVQTAEPSASAPRCRASKLNWCGGLSVDL